jgi:hypothetical protein
MPLAVLYSKGYRFDFYRNIFVHSGSITVKAVPTSVSISINGVPQKANGLDIINNSITVNGLRPGTYELGVSADGYSEWKKTVEVHSGISTEFWSVVLAPQNANPEKIDSSGVMKYFVSSFNEKIAYAAKTEKGIEILSYDAKSGEKKTLFSEENVEYRDEEFLNAEWNTKETLILNPVVKGGKNDFLILDIKQGLEPQYLSSLASFEQVDRARWSPKDEKSFFFLASAGPGENGAKNFYLADLDLKKTSLIAQNISAYDISSNSLYLLKENGILYKTDLSGESEEQITFSSIDGLKGKTPRVIAYDDKRQAIVVGDGRLFVHNNGKDDFFKETAQDAKSAQFSDDGKKLLFWSDNEINAMFLREWEVQPRRAENEIQQIVRFSSPVKNVFWYRDYEHIFFSNNGKVKLIELDARDRRICSDVLEYKSDDFSSSYDSLNGVFYFLDGPAGDQKNIFFLEIPKQEGFFGG